jgi:hypothetical protein
MNETRNETAPAWPQGWSAGTTQSALKTLAAMQLDNSTVEECAVSLGVSGVSRL